MASESAKASEPAKTSSCDDKCREKRELLKAAITLIRKDLDALIAMIESPTEKKDEPVSKDSVPIKLTHR